MDKKGKKQKKGNASQDAAQVVASEDQSKTDLPVVEEETKAQPGSSPQQVASATATPAQDSLEEEKVSGQASQIPPVANLGLKRSDSKFNMQRDATADSGKDTHKLYRPEFKYDEEKVGQEKIWELMGSYIGHDKKSIQRSIVNHVEYTLACTRFNFDDFAAYQATAYSVRDRLIEQWNDT